MKYIINTKYSPGDLVTHNMLPAVVDGIEVRFLIDEVLVFYTVKYISSKKNHNSLQSSGMIVEKLLSPGFDNKGLYDNT